MRFHDTPLSKKVSGNVGENEMISLAVTPKNSKAVASVKRPPHRIGPTVPTASRIANPIFLSLLLAVAEGLSFKRVTSNY